MENEMEEKIKLISLLDRYRLRQIISRFPDCVIWVLSETPRITVKLDSDTSLFYFRTDSKNLMISNCSHLLSLCRKFGVQLKLSEKKDYQSREHQRIMQEMSKKYQFVGDSRPKDH